MAHFVLGGLVPEVKLTESADERRFRNVFNRNCIYQIPLFQRPYRWKPAKVKQFQRDLLDTLESEDDLHFMGALIVHRTSGNFPDVDEYEIIDGQQRLTTIYLHIAAAVLVLSTSEGGGPEAWRLTINYLINNEFASQEPATFKIHPSREDRQPLNDVMRRVIESIGVATAAPPGMRLSYLGQGAPNPSTRIEKNFSEAVRFFREQHREGGNQLVVDVIDTLLRQMTVVVIEVVDPLSGPKIFDSLNSGQEPMTVGDLVRNDVFARVTDPGPTVEEVENHHWKPFFHAFGRPAEGHFENYFFPFGLISSPNTKKADIYQLLRRSWADERLDAVGVIEALKAYQPDYLMLRTNEVLDEHPVEVRTAFRRIFELGAPSAIYPFAMRLSRSVRGDTLAASECVSILEVIESFLTRRATVGQEPTGLHAVFKRLWSDAEDAGGVSASSVRLVISGARTVQWPNDEQFAQALRERRLYRVKITRFLLNEMNRCLGGDAPGGFDFWTEHVLPQSPGDGWGAFSDEQRRVMTDRLANLLPLTSEMNQQLSNSAYEVKRSVYAEDSSYKMTRKFAEENQDWTPSALEARAEALVALGLKRWPYGPVTV